VAGFASGSAGFIPAKGLGQPGMDWICIRQRRA
jgi:hypothetical protein